VEIKSRKNWFWLGFYLRFIPVPEHFRFRNTAVEKARKSEPLSAGAAWWWVFEK